MNRTDRTEAWEGGKWKGERTPKSHSLLHTHSDSHSHTKKKRSNHVHSHTESWSDCKLSPEKSTKADGKVALFQNPLFTATATEHRRRRSSVSNRFRQLALGCAVLGVASCDWQRKPWADVDARDSSRRKLKNNNFAIKPKKKLSVVWEDEKYSRKFQLVR